MKDQHLRYSNSMEFVNMYPDDYAYKKSNKKKSAAPSTGISKASMNMRQQAPSTNMRMNSFVRPKMAAVEEQPDDEELSYISEQKNN